MKKILILLSFCTSMLSPAFAQKNADKVGIYDEKLYNSVQWRSIGPYRGGRSCAVAGVKGKPNLFYFGATGGGVWRSTDGGRSWSNISDGFFGGSVGAIAISDEDNNIIYAGMGEQTIRGNISSGNGIWKTTDAGKTWTNMGLPETRNISRIRIHPKNPDIVFVAAMGNPYKSNPERGVFKSEDGGKTWKKTLFANEDAGAVDLCFDPSNPRVMFASTWKFRRKPWEFSSGGDGSAIWKSVDAGNTWTNISTADGLPKGTWGISGISVSAVNSDKVYTIIENENGGIFQSSDAGKTWSKVNENRELRQRAWYYSRIYADTKNENTVYVMNVSYGKSTDGGRNFKMYNAPHGDHHDLWIDPDNPLRMIIGDDGGAQTTYDGGETWSTYHNQPTAQFYRVITDNKFPYNIYVAQQDNSTIRVPHRTDGGSIGDRDWSITAGGESAHIAPDPLNPDIVYGTSYGGYLTRKDHNNGQERSINVWPDSPIGAGADASKYRFQWNAPIFFSPHNPKKLYAASNHLHATYNEGQTWNLISPDLTKNDKTKLGPSGGPITKDNTTVEYYCTIFATAESPRVKDLLWVGTDDGLVHVSRDGGNKWTDVTPKNLPEWIMINSIEPDPLNDGGCYIAATMYKHGDFRPFLYKTKNYGESWTKIVDGIKEDAFTRVIRADPTRPGLLYAGTETGLYISFNDGDSWQPFQLNLPIVPITDLCIKENNLIAATQGRSLWIIDDLTPLYQINEKTNEKEVVLYQPMSTYSMPGYNYNNSKFEGTNHPNGAMVHFYIKNVAEKDSISLSFSESNGTLIREFSTYAKEEKNKLKVKSGANMFNWDMYYEEGKKVDGMILWDGSMGGPRAIPGKYFVTLKVKGIKEESTFQVLADKRNPTTVAELKERFDFIQDCNKKASEAHESIISIRDLRKQLNEFTERLSDTIKYKPIFSKVKDIQKNMTEIEEALYQTKAKSGQDLLNYPIRLVNKLLSVKSGAYQGDFRPTDAQKAVAAELTLKIDEQLMKFKQIKEKDIAELNKLIRGNNVDTILLTKESK
ncbi:MAG: VPS10 domain-containing protein [Saprospiraceae bacterium]